MNYFNRPPKLSTNVPRFLLRRYIVGFLRKLIDWATVEYVSAVSYYEQNNEHTAKVLKKHYSPHVVLSKYPEFMAVCEKLIDQATWNLFSRDEQRVISSAYALAHK